ncbi:MAG: putative manganese-dependent inorganic diphosphatase [Eggerthellaceae bacterium]|nr:putative manganese-dependent inorganic diphosphatase [Eggerthellaceae bacterium]
MASPVIIVGHRNPDNDSICSAVALAYLKNELAKRDGTADTLVYEPARLGPMPPESKSILAEYGIEAPKVLPHVHARVIDVMTADPISVPYDVTVLDAGRLLRQENIRALVVTNEDGTYRGLITTRAIANRYISSTDRLEEGANAMAVAADLIESLGQKVDELIERDVLQLDREGLLKDAVEDLMASSLREAVVLDEDGFCIGIVTRSDVAQRPKRRVILVDHNETRQAALGIEEAEVIEIVDHHRIADVMTANPIPFTNLPVGSTATIITMEFRKYGVEVPKGIAAALLSAIMTDTVILKSPTATAIDVEQVRYLAEILEVDPTEFGLKVFRARGGEGRFPIKELVEADSKEFQLGDHVVLIAQHETVDLPAVMQREDEIRAHMAQIRETRGYEFVLLLVTDIMAEGSMFMVEGNPRTVNRTFGIECTHEGGVWMPGILSRKKQVAPRILGM